MMCLWAGEICVDVISTSSSTMPSVHECTQAHVTFVQGFESAAVDGDDLEEVVQLWEVHVAKCNAMPIYKRNKKPGEMERFDFKPFLKQIAYEIEQLEGVLMQMQSKIRHLLHINDPELTDRYHGIKKKAQTQLALLKGRQELYKDKVVYLLQYADKPHKKVCLLLHGLSNHPQDVSRYAPVVEEVLYVIPQGFEPFHIAWPFMQKHYQWFHVGNWWNPDQDRVREGLAKVRPMFIRWIDDISDLPGLSHDDIIVCGPSQGAITALDIVCNHDKIRHCVAISGALDPELSEATYQRMAGKNILMIHATNDEVVPYKFSEQTAEKMLKAGVSIKRCVFESLGESPAECHRIFKSAEAQEHMQQFFVDVCNENQKLAL